MLRVGGEEDYLPKSRNYDQSYVSMMHHKNWSCSDFGAWRFPQHFLSADFFNIFLDRSIDMSQDSSRLHLSPTILKVLPFLTSVFPITILPPREEA